MSTSKLSTDTTRYDVKKSIGSIEQRVKMDFVLIVGRDVLLNAINDTFQPTEPMST